MPSIVKSKDKGISNLDPRNKSLWDLDNLGDRETTYEPQLMDSVCSEFNDIAGFPVDVYLYTPARRDIFYGESVISTLDGPYRTKMLFETPKENYAINILGMSVTDTIQYAEMSKAIWLRDIEQQLNKKYDLDFDEDRMPQIGDVIHCLWNNSRYEVVSANASERVFMMREHAWTLTLKPYRVGNEGSDEREMMFDTEPTANETDDRDDNFGVLTNQEQTKEKRKIEELANTEKSKQIQEIINPESLDTSYYGYFKGLKK